MSDLPNDDHQVGEMGLVLSSDAKPRLKWTRELHCRFVEAVSQLGGAERATPKSLMRVMGIHGLTLYHLKSHLQIAQALQMQMEVQKKLHEQIEVQRHLQLRIEAQGKYLQSVLQKAHDTLSGYHCCSVEVEQAKAQLSELVSIVDSGRASSLLTQSEGSSPRNTKKDPSGCNICSLDSSITSSENSEGMEETQKTRGWEVIKRCSTMLSLMEMHPAEKGGGSASESGNKKRIKSTKNEHLFLDLNRKSLNGLDDSSPNVFDLNCNGTEEFDGNI